MHHINQKWAMGKSAHWVPIAHFLKTRKSSSVTEIDPHRDKHIRTMSSERRASLLNRQTRPGTLWPVAPMQAAHICSQYV